MGTIARRTKVLFLILTLPVMTLAATEDRKISDAAHGIALTIKNSNWIFLSGDETQDASLLFVARPKSAAKTSLTWRVDNSESNLSSAKKYGEHWLKDYPKFGFEFYGAQDVKYGELDGFEMELKSKDQSLKQFIVHREKEFWIFTCSASPSEFRNAWNSCKKILQTARLTK